MNHNSPDSPVACRDNSAEALLRGWRTLSAASAAFLAELREFDLQRGYREPMPRAAAQRQAASTRGASGREPPKRQPRKQEPRRSAACPARQAGADSTAKWLHTVCGIDEAEVREALRVAYKLLNLPRTEAALAAGELSYRKVRALTSVATAGTETELLPFAVVMTDAQVAQYCSRLRKRAAAQGEDAESEPSAPAAGDVP